MPLLMCMSPLSTKTVQHTPLVSSYILLQSKIDLIGVPGCLIEDSSRPLATSNFCIGSAMTIASAPILIALLFVMVSVVLIANVIASIVMIAMLVFLITAVAGLVIAARLDVLPAIVTTLLLTIGTLHTTLEGLITKGAVTLALERSWL